MHQDSKLKTLFYRLSLLIPDTWYLSLKYYKNFGRFPNLKCPKTFNEKLQWLKLYDRNPIYTTMVDKYSVKQYVADIIGEEYIIPTLGVWDRAEDINFDILPNQFVLKATHDSGRVLICKDKATLNRVEIIKEMHKSLRRNFYVVGREWPYKYVRRRIIAEIFMVDENNTDLKDYKIFCFNGQPEIVEVDYGRFTKHMRNIYDKEWNFIEMEMQYPSDRAHKIQKPENFDKMLDLARRLSKDIPHIRVDFYNIHGRLYWGELTFFHESGMGHFNPNVWDKRLGELIVLPPVYSAK